MDWYALSDRLYARFANQRLIFPGGWGDEAVLERAGTYFPRAAEVAVSWRDGPPVVGGERRILSFRSPYAAFGLPSESFEAHAEWLLPTGWTRSTPLALVFASTGDEGFAHRRQHVSLPLLHRGVSTVILENPFYGRRCPAGQEGSKLRYVSDLWCMGMALWEEGRSLLAWLEGQGFERLGVCGISLGGQIASHVASLWTGPLAVATLVAPHNANAVFVDGVLRTRLDRYALSRHPRARRAGGPEAALGAVLEPTDLRRFPLPQRPDACVRVGARRDVYVPQSSVRISHQSWPGSELRWLDKGHVTTVAFHGCQLVQPMLDAFERLKTRSE